MIEIVDFKKSMSKFATGVVVVTAIFEQEKIGITINSFNSVSLEPKLILYSLEKKSARYYKFIDQQYFVINILAENQKEISESFAGKEMLNWDLISDLNSKFNSVPILNGVAAYFACKLHSIFDGGDHSIIVAEVLNTESWDRKPLVYHEACYKNIGNKI